MNDTLILPVMNNPYQPLDCSGITLQMCDNLNSDINSSVIVMAVGLLMQFIRMLKHDDPISNYLKDSIIPELMVYMGFGLIMFVRFFSG